MWQARFGAFGEVSRSRLREAVIDRASSSIALNGGRRLCGAAGPLPQRRHNPYLEDCVHGHGATRRLREVQHQANIHGFRVLKNHWQQQQCLQRSTSHLGILRRLRCGPFSHST
jgi:hypothetical protein